MHTYIHIFTQHVWLLCAISGLHNGRCCQRLIVRLDGYVMLADAAQPFPRTDGNKTCKLSCSWLLQMHYCHTYIVLHIIIIGILSLHSSGYFYKRSKRLIEILLHFFIPHQRKIKSRVVHHCSYVPICIITCSMYWDIYLNAVMEVIEDFPWKLLN